MTPPQFTPLLQASSSGGWGVRAPCTQHPAPRTAKVWALGGVATGGGSALASPPLIPPSQVGLTSGLHGTETQGALPGASQEPHPLGPRGPGQELPSGREWGWGPRKAWAGVRWCRPGWQQDGSRAHCPPSPPDGSTGPGRVPWAPPLAHRGDLQPPRRLRPPSSPQPPVNAPRIRAQPQPHPGEPGRYPLHSWWGTGQRPSLPTHLLLGQADLASDGPAGWAPAPILGGVGPSLLLLRLGRGLGWHLRGHLCLRTSCPKHSSRGSPSV